jgi:hypothetical protein
MKYEYCIQSYDINTTKYDYQIMKANDVKEARTIFIELNKDRKVINKIFGFIE